MKKIEVFGQPDFWKAADDEGRHRGGAVAARGRRQEGVAAPQGCRREGVKDEPAEDEPAAEVGAGGGGGRAGGGVGAGGGGVRAGRRGESSWDAGPRGDAGEGRKSSGPPTLPSLL